MTSDQEIRLECLRLAQGRELNDQEILQTAQAWAGFIFGTSDAEVPRAAREPAKMVVSQG